MTPKPKSSSKTMQALRRLALRLPDTDEGVACEGTAIEKRTIKTRGKAFLFLGARDAMLKLGPSLSRASELAAEDPSRYQAGATGWVKVTFGDESPPLDLLATWIAESHRIVAGQQSKKPSKNPTETPKRPRPRG